MMGIHRAGDETRSGAVQHLYPMPGNGKFLVAYGEIPSPPAAVLSGTLLLMEQFLGRTSPLPCQTTIHRVIGTHAESRKNHPVSHPVASGNQRFTLWIAGRLERCFEATARGHGEGLRRVVRCVSACYLTASARVRRKASTSAIVARLGGAHTWEG